MELSRKAAFVFGLSTLLAACGADHENNEKPACSVEEQTGCDTGTVCEAVKDQSPACFAPLVVRGRVLESSAPDVGIADAIVVARDINGALVSRGTVTSAADGSYELAIPATRDASGRPVAPEVTLRADAAGHATFPSGLRVALPIGSDAPVQTNGKWIIENDSTDVALDTLPNDSAGLGTIRGSVHADHPGGTLVVAGGVSGVASSDGSFTVFNVPAGATEVRGYKAGLDLSSASVDVAAGATRSDVLLSESKGSMVSVSGDVSFVNAGAQQTSVVLVVASTFNATLARGETPVGLRQFPVSGRYSFANVPAGEYVVLAAFENDDLVRDPDTSIGGAAIQRLTVGSSAVSVPGFKITGALAVRSPGANGPEVVSGTPKFSWADDSSEDGYELTVYDNFGNVVQHTDVPRVTGSSDVSASYSGPALTRGYYQFRAVSYRMGKGGSGSRTYISATEDLKGVFIIE
ncbi:MAG TPA: hypothetical protein VFK05_20935 [Polyangiaceae bacterium]|nr:hypothetical protein [Polyangiaceae bacterium]